MASSAGNSVRAAMVDQATTITPATPTERRNMNSNCERPARPMSTVVPEKKTALPAVAVVRATASATVCPCANSSRKRAVTNRE